MNNTKNKKKILLISDHALSPSGVGCQSRFLAQGLISKGNWTVRQLGAAVKHTDYNTVKVNDDFIIKPIDGFGNRELIAKALLNDKPDVIILFTDPRFFTWLFQIEDEIHDVCPIAYWHVWDNKPYPKFNDFYYESTDLINCHSYLTYEMLKDHYPNKVNFVPHAIPDNIFYPLKEKEINQYKIDILGYENKDAFTLIWVNRNTKRKRPGDVIWSWSIFLEKIKDKKDKPILIMHTNPEDKEGQNLFEIAKHFNVEDSIVFSNQKLNFDKMNVLYNISDACLNTSYAEGFGLSTLEALNCAKPIIAPKTGGLTRQVVNHLDQTENGVALNIDFQTCVGNQTIPYIFEDYVSCENIANGILKIYNIEDKERKEIGLKAREYVLKEFSYNKTIDLWNQTLSNLIDNWKNNPVKRWSLTEVGK